MRKESEDTQAVVDGDHYCALLGQGFSVVLGLRARSDVIAAAVDPNHHRTLLTSRLGCGPDVQIEAVLADFLIGSAAGGILHTNRTECVGCTNSVPVGYRLRN